ncbi:MAG TPA: BMC domain-containing protein [Tepidisphaeraceae bacterium]|nr:BMC domain-containing protein [Tepidisphaeraceae bacterium]
MTALGLLEVKSWTATMAALDAAEKAGTIRVLQVEINDLYGACAKFTGSTSDVGAALAAGRAVAQTMHAECVTDLVPAPSPASLPAYDAKPEFSPLIEQDVVVFPRTQRSEDANKERNVSEQAPFAIGMIETQGLTAVIEAIDTAVKAANVEVLGREKLGGGYITVLIKGDVAAVKAAIDAGREKVEGLGKLIAAHVIPRPSTAVLSLLPKV